MRIARTDDGRTFSTPVILDTPKDDEAFVRAFVSAARQIAEAGAGEIQGLVAGKPLWKRRAGLEDELRTALGVPVHFENDTALVGLGEAHYGAGRGADIFVYLTISTGVNGVRIVDGRIDRSAQGFEIGGQYISTDGTVSWEEMISGSAVRKRFNMHPKDLGKGHAIWDELAEKTAYGLHNTILHWSPNRIALGGSMLNEVGISVERVQMHAKHIMRKFAVLPEIVHSELGDVGGIWGALALLKQRSS